MGGKDSITRSLQGPLGRENDMYNRLATLYVHYTTFEMIHLSAKGAFNSNTSVQLEAFYYADISLLSPQQSRLSHVNRYALK